ncbi:MAG: methionyl-tRNA formyltransferase [Acidimicrobiales bacterium]
MARLVFLGTPRAAVAPLQALVGAGHEVCLVVTRPDRRRGRRGEPAPSPVKAAALDLGLTVAEEPEAAVGLGAELGVVVAYGALVKKAVLDHLPMVNLHFSLLPRWRGAAPVERAILAGDAVTGVCLMGLEEGLDTGPVYGCRQVTIGPEETAGELGERLGEVGTALLVERLSAGSRSLGQPRAQVGEPTYAAKVSAEELRLDWSLPAEELARVVRVGRAWTTFRGRRLLVLRGRAVPGDSVGAEGAPSSGQSWEGGRAGQGRAGPGSLRGVVVATATGGLEMVEVQPEGRARMQAWDWARGARIVEGEVLGR